MYVQVQEQDATQHPQLFWYEDAWGEVRIFGCEKSVGVKSPAEETWNVQGRNAEGLQGEGLQES